MAELQQLRVETESANLSLQQKLDVLKMDQLTLETEISNKDAAIKDLGKQITDLLKTIEERNVKILREERVNKARTPRSES